MAAIHIISRTMARLGGTAESTGSGVSKVSLMGVVESVG